MNNNRTLNEYNNKNNMNNHYQNSDKRKAEQIRKLYANKDKPKNESIKVIYLGIIFASIALVVLGISLMKGESLTCTKVEKDDGMEVTTSIVVEFEKGVAVSGTSTITAKLIDNSESGYWDTKVSKFSEKYNNLTNPRYKNNQKKHIYTITSDIDVGINVLYNVVKTKYDAEGYSCK